MGVTKKPAVAAKATKKRGRPAGSRNTKTLEKMKIGDSLSFDELNRLNSSVSSEGWIPPVTDWEGLAKRLQTALATEMRECDSYKKLFEDMQANSKPVRLLTFWQRIKLLVTGTY
jgi:hypothetical protein